MPISRAGAGFSLSHEAIILEGYPDPGTGGEPWTIGGGHTAAAGGMKPYRGQIISLAKALQIFVEDMAKYSSRVEKAIKRNKSQHVIDGFSSFDLNTGKIFSGTVDDKWNAGDEAGAMRTLGLYVNAAGKPLPGLQRRRKEEIALITKGIYPNAKILVKDRYNSPGRYVTVDQLPWDSAETVVTFTPTPVVPPAQPEPEKNVFITLMELIGKALLWTSSKLSQGR
jgi:lysozyme